MNEIICNKKLENIEYRIGSLFKDPESDDIFILARIQIYPNEYITINLKDGTGYSGICKSVDDAVQGLKYIGYNSKITID